MYNDKSDIVRVKAENVASMIKPGQCDGILAAPNAKNKAAIPPDLTFDKVVQQIAINEQREKDMQSLTGLVLGAVGLAMSLPDFNPWKEAKK